MPDYGKRLFNIGVAPFKRGTRVYLTTPDGQRVGFTFEPELYVIMTVVGPSTGIFGPTYIPKFTPDPGVNVTLEVPESSKSIGGNSVSFDSAGNAVYPIFGFPYNPDTYILTMEDGTRYTYDQRQGLKSIVDPNGVKLTVTDNGIYHSTAGAIEFVRDNRGRIKQIVGPPPAEGDEPVTVNYEYDVKRDLVTVTRVDATSLPPLDLGDDGDLQQQDAISHYVYLDDPQFPHFLDRIYDSQNQLLFDAEFDDDGRLTSSTDALGNSVSQDFDLEAMKGTITDAKQ